MRTSVLPFLVLLAFGAPALGCDQLSGGNKSKSSETDEDEDDDKKKKKKKDEDEDKPKPTAKPTATATAAPTPTAVETAAPTQQPDAPPTASGKDPPPTGPNGRSAVPTLEEWSKPGEVTVLGSSKLDCETKKVREWIRVSCRGESKERGKPTGVNITKGGGKGDTFTFASGGVASLIYPFFEGQDLEATFRWEKTRKGFKAQWPRGAPQPTAYGIFEGGDAHLIPKK